MAEVDRLMASNSDPHSGRSLPTFLRSFSLTSDQDSDFEELPDFTADVDLGDGPTDLFRDHVDAGTSPKRDHTYSIQVQPLPFTALRPTVWMQGIPIKVQIINWEKHEAHIKILNPNLYTIQLNHGDFQWTVRRRYKHFATLHQQLSLFRITHKIPVPSKTHTERRQSMHGQKNKVPRFPKKPDFLVRDIEKRKRHLEEYLQNVLRSKVYRNHAETLKFLEVSHLSFKKKLGKKRKEGAVMKCSGGRQISIGCCGCLGKFHFAGRWNKRWLLVKDSFLAYVRPSDGVICDVMLMDTAFDVETGLQATGAHHGIQIQNLNRNLLAKAWTHRKAEEWKKSILEAANTTGKDYTHPNRFHSYAPVRDNSYARWFVDGSSYFAAVAEALENAKEEIYITDWWLSPEIYLKRPITEGNRWRLDVILERKAKQGVKIYILLYKEMSIALNIQSIYSKHALVQKCPENIKIMRHPDHGAGGVLLWAHHEKIVAVDQKIAFLGGFDLCYGRWDDEHHRLTDLGCIVYDTTGVDDETEIEDELNESVDLRAISIAIRPPSPMSEETQKAIDESLVIKMDEKIDSAESSMQQLDELNGKMEYDTEEPDETETDHDLDECVCFRSRAESKHSYSNSSVEEDEYSAMLKKSDVNGSVKQNSVTGENVEVVTAMVHQSLEDNNEKIPQELDNDKKIESSESRNVDKLNHPENEFFLNNNEVPKLEKEHRVTFFDVVQEIRDPKKNQEKDRHLWKNSSKSGTFKRLQEDANTYQPKPDESSDIMNVEPNIDAVDSKDSSVLLLSYSKLGTSNDINHENADDAQNKTKLNSAQDEPHKEIQSSNEPSQTSKSYGATDAVSAEPVISNSSNRESWARRKLRKSLSLKTKEQAKEPNKEPNNNENDDNIDEVEGNQARNRWKLVLNVQKFHSSVRQPQVKTPLPEKEMETLTPTSVKMRLKKHNLQDLLKHQHRDSVDDLKDLKKLKKKDKQQLDIPTLQRTTSEIAIDELGLMGSSKLWIGKDYVNFIQKDFENLHSPFEDFIDRNTTPRMPWHDIGGVVYGKAARDVARHFIGRWNFTKIEKLKSNKDYPLLLPKCYKSYHSVPQVIKDNCDEVRTQILRSSCGWSAGVKKIDKSIHTAYISYIENAKHYIYIENQFFITTVGEKAMVKNEIGEALFERIVRAHNQNETFRVYVVMPLLPAFEGQIGKSGGFAIQAITHYNYTSISRGENSLWVKLQKLGIDPLKYLIFCGLRKHEELNGKLLTELIYVHSKLMIVDDDVVIIGSANINDRSLLGTRDSEIAVLVEDIHKREVKFNGKPHMAGNFASSLRKTLFMEHLWMDKDDPLLDDPVCDQFYKKIWIHRATTNTTTFQKVFHCLPSDKVKTFSEVDQYLSQKSLAETNPEQARKELSRIKGYLVLMPLHFLEKEVSIIPTVGRESFLPNTVWT